MPSDTKPELFQLNDLTSDIKDGLTNADSPSAANPYLTASFSAPLVNDTSPGPAGAGGIAGAADTQITFGVPAVDAASGWDNGTDEYVIPATGTYQISAQVLIADPTQSAGSATAALIVLALNPAAPALHGSAANSGPAGAHGSVVTGIVSLAAGTRVSLYARNSGAAATLGSARLSIHRIG